MATVVYVQDRDALVLYIQNTLDHWMISASDLKMEPYTYDPRIGWDTYIVTLPNFGVLGFTNGDLK